MRPDLPIVLDDLDSRIELGLVGPPRERGRRFIGVELKGSYYQQAASNLASVGDRRTSAQLLPGFEEVL